VASAVRIKVSKLEAAKLKRIRECAKALAFLISERDLVDKQIKRAQKQLAAQMLKRGVENCRYCGAVFLKPAAKRTDAGAKS